MHKFLLIFIVLLTTQSSFAQGNKQITLEDLWKNNTFRVRDVPGFKAMKDGKHYSQIDRRGDTLFINIYNLETGQMEKSVFNSTAIKMSKKKNVKVEDYVFNDDETQMLLFANSESIYRHSAISLVFLYDIATSIASIVDFDKLMHATLSPDGKKVAFVKHNNLYVKDFVRNNFDAITSDGEKNKIINGNCDWVYEEEFSFTRAFQWSPDSKHIAFYRFDESNVPEYTIAKYTGLYPEQYTYKYPKAGESNSIVKIGIYNIENKRTEYADIGRNTDQYIPRIKWTSDPSKLCIYRLNRLQNKLELLLTDATAGTSKPIYADTNKYFININDEIKFLPDGHSIIISSERNGYSHLYNWNWEQKKLTDLTTGNYDVDALVGVDVSKGIVYYTSAESSPLERKLYKVNFDGGNKKCLTPEKGVHSITPCQGYNYFMGRYSAINKVPVYSLYDSSGKLIRVLEDNKELDAKMKEYALGNIRLMQLKGANDDLNAWMITPPGFDESKKYPVLMYQYSGPGSQEVADRFPLGNFWWHQMLAEKGYIVVCTDGTGTGFRGEEFRKKTYLQLGKMESEDQIAAAQSLGNLPYVDKSRIGIWGWSYGGFMSSTCILKGANVFKAAIAVAPVTNWRYYDNIYTERYMRTPNEKWDPLESTCRHASLSIL